MAVILWREKETETRQTDRQTEKEDFRLAFVVVDLWSVEDDVVVVAVAGLWYDTSRRRDASGSLGPGHTSIHLSSPSPSSMTMTMASSTRRTDILSLIHIRSDGRRPHEIRHMSCHLGALPSTNCGSALPTSACSGSALVTMGLTQVICVVRGPCDIGRRSDELPDRYDSNACSLFLFMP